MTVASQAESNVVLNLVYNPLETLRRMGRWQYDTMIPHCLEFFKPSGLLAAANWPGVNTNEFHIFWHERFMASTPRELVLLLFPFLPNLQMAITELGKKASFSMQASPRLLEYVAKIVIQDAVAGMCDKYPEHDVHRLLLTSAVFR